MKTRSLRIRWMIAGLLALAVGIETCLLLHMTQSQMASEPGAATDRFQQYISDRDMDGDGIDDQTDMLRSAREYIATEPTYESRYYAGGYPDDEYGVCTDVVAFACKGSGYDLKELVAEDVSEARDSYDIDIQDSNIDFRRVENLNVYFSRHAQSLTRDLQRTSEWQGGDIVVFGNHIAMVSDKRNGKGIPYIIHLSSEQKTYEENTMKRWEKKSGIIGHYRIGEPEN